MTTDDFNPFADTTSATPETSASDGANLIPAPKDEWNVFDEIAREKENAARSALASDPNRAAKSFNLSRRFGMTQDEADLSLDVLDARAKEEDMTGALDSLPTTSAYFAAHPLSAPIFSADMDHLKRIEQMFAAPTPGSNLIKVDPSFDRLYSEYGPTRSEPVQLFGDDELEGIPKDLVDDLAWRKTGAESASNELKGAFDMGVATSMQGELWARLMRGETVRDQAFDQRNAALQATIDSGPKEQGFFASAANLVGSMVGSVQSALPTATSAAAFGFAAGMASTGAGVGLVAGPGGSAVGGVIGGLSGLAYLGAVTLSGMFDATSRIESGMLYKTLTEAGVGHEDARNLAAGVGTVNGLIETALTASAGSVASSVIGKELKRSILVKLGDVMTSPNIVSAIGKASAVWGAGAAGEAVTEALQEAVTMAGEEAGRVFYGAKLDEITTKGAINRIADTAVQTFKGALVLGGGAAAFGAGHGVYQAHKARATREFFQALSDTTGTMEAQKIAPDAVTEFIAAQAEGSSASTTYIDGNRFAEALNQSGISREELRKRLPQVDAQLDTAVATGTDVEIPTADFASIASTDLGRSLVDHVRLNPDDLSYAEAVEVERSYRLMMKNYARDAFVGDNENAATIDRQIDRLLRGAEKTELSDYEGRVYDQIVASTKAANPESPINAKVARTNARLAAVSAAVLAKRANIPLGKFIELNGIQVQPVTSDVASEGAAPSVRQGGADAPTRGTYVPSERTINLAPDADLSTFAHEVGHWYLDQLFMVARLDGIDPTIVEDVQVLLKAFGLSDLAEWDALGFEGQRKYQERFALWTEQYLAEGKAPDYSLRRLFGRFGQWIREVYRNLGGAARVTGAIYEAEFGEALPELSDEVRRVLDRMVASSEQIDQAMAAKGLKPLFEEKPADMSDEDWAEMRLAIDDSERAALEKLDEVRAKDEKWAQRARSRVLKEIQQKAKETRDKVRERVEKEIASRPEQVALDLVSKGQRDGRVGMNLKLDEATLVAEGYGPNVVAKLRTLGCVKKGGLSPTESAKMIQPFARSIRTGKKLVEALLRAGDRERLIEEETTARCLAKHSDLFDPQKVDAAVSEAVYNEARARIVAHELKYLANDRTLHSRVTIEAARRVADDLIREMPVGNVRLKSFMAAESRASREAYAALQRNDRRAAVDAKRRQMIAHELVARSLELKKDLDRFKELRKKIFGSDKKLGKTRELDIIQVARYVLTNRGYGRVPAALLTPQDALKCITALRKYDEERAAEYDQIIKHFGFRANISWNALSVAEATEVMEVVRSLWQQSADARRIQLDGKSEDLKQVVGQLVAQTASKPSAITIPRDHQTTPSTRVGLGLLALKSAMTRVESWCIRMDGGKPGLFHAAIYSPVSDAANRFRNANNDYQKRLADIVRERAADWDRVVDVEYKFGGYTFVRKSELIGAILHTGNESNKRKLLIGARGDGTRWCIVNETETGEMSYSFAPWDAFFAKLCKDGIITKADMDAVQAIWDLLESTKADAQKAYKRMYGTYFKEIEASAVSTPWGDYRGGYVPARTDPEYVREAERNLAAEVIDQQNFASVMPVNRPGFAENRVENYTKPLLLDVSFLSGHLSQVLKFAHIAPAATDVGKIIANRDFAEAIDSVNPTAIQNMLKPWLKRSYEQSVSDRGRYPWIDRVCSHLRGLAGMGIMAGHLINALAGITGISVAATKVSPNELAKATMVVMGSPKDAVSDVKAKSEFMRARLDDRAFEYQSEVERAAAGKNLPLARAKNATDKIVTLYSTADSFRDWVKRHAYFLQTAMQIPIDTIVWTAAYNKAIRRGDTEADAVRYADSVVRTTQSDFSPENISSIEAGSPLGRMFLVFYNYFNMQANLLGERWELAKETKNYGRFAIDALLIVWIPSVVTALIQRAASDGFDVDDDDDFDFFDFFQLVVGEPLKGVVAMAPFVGGVVNTAGTHLAKAGIGPAELIYGTNPYAGKIVSIPAEDLVSSAGATFIDLYKLSEGEDVNARNATRHFLDLTTVVTGIPFSALKRPAGFAAGVSDGQFVPETPADYAQGIVTGKIE